MDFLSSLRAPSIAPALTKASAVPENVKHLEGAASAMLDILKQP
jgi:hypothetical protein